MHSVKRVLGSYLCLSLLAAALAHAEDIDLFAGLPEGLDIDKPSVIFVLDNTSNWARKSQKWPSGDAQGQSEVEAIRTALQGLEGEINVGLMKFTTGGNANENGAYVRFALQLYDDESAPVLNETLIDIRENINDPSEKRNSNEEYGNLVYDIYNYLAGARQSFEGAGTLDIADDQAYDSRYSRFLSPLNSENVCSDINIVFIGNPNASGPSSDSAANSSALAALYEAAGQTVPDALAGSASGDPIVMRQYSTVVGDPDTVYFDELSTAFYKTNRQGQTQCTEDESQARGLCDGVASCSCLVASENCERRSRNSCKWKVGVQTSSVTVTGPEGKDGESGRDFNLDDWAKFLFNYGVPVAIDADSDGIDELMRLSVRTFTIDVFNAQPNALQTSLLNSAADVGGGDYFAATSEGQLKAAIGRILTDIVSASSTYAAVTLPVNAGEKTQSKNQVYIGSFRPADKMEPRWFGNLKRYRLGLFSGAVELADARYQKAINIVSGTFSECAVSFWTGESAFYNWQDLGVSPAPRSQCEEDFVLDQWSDKPDGPFVEKGGVAQQIRETDPASSSRNLWTLGTEAPLQEVVESSLSSDDYQYLRGALPGVGELWTAAMGGRRPSAHGDVIHSRPAVINYGGMTEDTIKIYYGANDGLFRKVDAIDGEEEWALIASSHLEKVSRLRENSPLILYEALPETSYPETSSAEDAMRKSYFFDGTAGQYIDYGDDDMIGPGDSAYIFPSMRRGGRQIYGFDVTDPGIDPALLWVHGCDGDQCSTGFEGIGETWSTPIAFTVKGYEPAGASIPVVAFGGGFDACLDTDLPDFPDNCSQGSHIYIVKADDGTLLRKFPTAESEENASNEAIDAPIVADLAVIDVDFDGDIDYAYAADAAGAIYRITFSDPGDETFDAETHWGIAKIAETKENPRRFFNRPLVFVADEGKIGVALGSGDREKPLKANYPYQESVENRFYMVFDMPGEDSSVLDLDGDAMIDAREFTPGDVIPSDSKGWFLTLGATDEERGEQVVTTAAVGGRSVFFNSYRPGGPSQGLCAPPIGVSKSYAVPITSPADFVAEDTNTPGMPIPPVIATVTIEPNPNEPDADKAIPETRTVCIGCSGFDVVELDPTISLPLDKLWWIESVDD